MDLYDILNKKFTLKLEGEKKKSYSDSRNAFQQVWGLGPGFLYKEVCYFNLFKFTYLFFSPVSNACRQGYRVQEDLISCFCFLLLIHFFGETIEKCKEKKRKKKKAS